MFTASFWRATAERAVRSFAASLLSVWVIGGEVFDVRGVDWGSALGVGGGAALVSVLLSLVAGSGVGPVGSPSFVTDAAAAGEPAGLPPITYSTSMRPADGERLHPPAGGYPGGPPPADPPGAV